MPQFSQPQSYLSTITSAVTGKFNTAQTYATQAWSLALDYLESLKNEVVDFTPEFISLVDNITDISVNDYTPQAPDKPDLSLTLPTSPTAPSLEEVTVDPVDVPTLDAVAPSISLPEAPDVIYPTEPGEAPVTGEIEYPVKPDYALPSVPSIEDLTIPSPPSITIPTFEGTMPVDDLEMPAVTFTYNEQVYQSDLKDAVFTRLLNDIEQGGTGLGAEAENAIWERARARKELINERTYQEALEYFAARGWTIPPGALNARLAEALKEQIRADEQLNYEIAIEQARLAHDYSKWAVIQALQLNGQLMTHANNVAQRSFDSAKYTQEAAILIFNAAVIRYNAKLETYKTAAAVYESRIRASLLELERYKTELEGVKVSSEINRQRVEIYRVQVQAVDTMMNLFRTEMESARIQADVERLKLEGYREKVNAYTAKLGAITTRYNVYQAQIAGETEKAKVYSEQVRAYSAQVEGVRALATINIETARAQIEENRALVEQYRADIEKYNAELRSRVSELESNARVYGYDIDGYRADVQLADTKINADIKSYDAKMTHETNRINSEIQQAQLNLAQMIRAHELQLEAMKTGGSILSQMVASALTAVSASAQLSYRGGYDHTTNQTSSEQYTTTHSHSYAEKCCSDQSNK